MKGTQRPTDSRKRNRGRKENRPLRKMRDRDQEKKKKKGKDESAVNLRRKDKQGNPTQRKINRTGDSNA